ncbi:MAG TPA: hypothetical protein VE974_06485 [Thermoanaerobaculia bacterium]|nr:hypothetical protein [Thermoanaerobaculia bacterium]
MPIRSDTAADRRIAIALFVVTLGCYAYTFGGGGWNENASFALVRAVVEQRTISIERYLSTTGDVSRSGGRTYSNKPPGVAFLAIPVYAALVAGERAAGLEFDQFKVTTANAYVCTVAVCGVLGALIPVALFLHGRAQGIADARWLVLVSLTVALGTPLFGYATALWVHVPSAALLFLAYVLLHRSPAAAGFLAAMAVATNYVSAIPMAIFAILLFLPRERRAARLFRFCAGAVLPAVLVGWYHTAAFGAFYRTPIDSLTPEFVTRGAMLGIFVRPSLDALWGVTFSPYRGLFYSAPVLLVALAGAITLFRAGKRRELVTLAAIVLFFLLVNASFNGWFGGYSFSARYLLPIVPFLGVAMLYASSVPRTLFVLLALVSVTVQTVVAAVDVHAPTEIRRPLVVYVLPQLLHGELQVSGTHDYGRTRVGHVAVNPLSATTCNCPSAWSSFNLGEPLFGQGSVLSLLPLLLWMAGGSAVVFRLAWQAEERG